MNEVHVRDGLFALFPPDTNGDWEDVLRRAAGPRHLRRLSLVVAIALLLLLVVGSALALSGQFSSLFHGTPVKDLTPREKFLMSEFDIKGKAELIATRGSSAFYVIRGSDGRICYSVGENRRNLTPAQKREQFRFGGADCIDARVFPSRAMPVLSHAYFSFRPGDDAARMVGIQGFAADPVAAVGVIGRQNKISLKVPVEGNVFSGGRGWSLEAVGSSHGERTVVSCGCSATPSAAHRTHTSRREAAASTRTRLHRTCHLHVPTFRSSRGAVRS